MSVAIHRIRIGYWKAIGVFGIIIIPNKIISSHDLSTGKTIGRPRFIIRKIICIISSTRTTKICVQVIYAGINNPHFHTLAARKIIFPSIRCSKKGNTIIIIDLFWNQWINRFDASDFGNLFYLSRIHFHVNSIQYSLGSK